MRDKRKNGRAGAPGLPDGPYNVTGFRLEPDGTVRVTVERVLGERVSYAPPEGGKDPDTIEPTAIYKPHINEWTSDEWT